MIRFLIAFLLCILLGGTAQAETIVGPGGQGPTGATAALVTVAATNTAVNLTALSQYITIVNTSATATIYFSEVSPATTTSGPILPNSAYTYQGTPLSVFYLISSSGSVSAGVIAH